MRTHRKPRTPTLPALQRAFRTNKLRVRYAGRRWKLVDDRGRWLLIERRGITQWIPTGAAK